MARPFPISLNSVSKHIRILERAELVERRKSGRDHFLSLNPAPLDAAARWIEAERRRWAWRLETLDSILKEPKMSDPPMRTIEVTHVYQASPERVFDAFLDPAIAGRFLFATATGEMVKAELDPRVGGRFTFIDRRPDMGDVEHVGEFVEIDRPRRLVFTFGVPQFDPHMTRVTIAIQPAGPGCTLTLVHEGVSPDYAEGTADGWSRILAGLEPALEGVKAAGWS